MLLVWNKVISLFVMLAITLIVGLLPLKVRKIIMQLPKSYERSEIILSASLCFGGGILMGTVLLHLLPETLEKVEEAVDKGFIVNEREYPIGELVLCAGFFVMYFLEELVHLYVHNHHNPTDDHRAKHHADSRHNSIVHSDMQKHESVLDIHKYSIPDEDGPMDKKGSVASHILRARCESTPSVAVLVGCENPVLCNDPSHKCQDNAKMSVGDISRLSDRASDTSSEAGEVEVTTVKSILVILALSIHGCLEGLSLGLEKKATDVWLMFAALTAHKVAIGFSIGMELLEKGVILKYYVLYMVIFSLASPIGITIGTLFYQFVDQNLSSGIISFMILQGLSGGTIMYVVFCEVLERERSKSNGRFIRLLALFSGFLIMALLELVGEPHEEHEEVVTQSSFFDEFFL